MKNRVVIVGKPAVAIYENVKNMRCWYITKKFKKKGHVFLFGYVRCLRPRLLTGFQHVPSEVLFDLGKDIWKVPEEHWWRCPLVDIEPHGGPEVVCCTDQGAG